MRHSAFFCLQVCDHRVRGPKGRCGRDDCHPKRTGNKSIIRSFAGGNISQAPVVRRFLQTRSLDETGCFFGGFLLG